MSRGDICWLELADVGRRPALVLTRDPALPMLRNITIAYLTRRIRDIPTEVRLDADDGMPDECVVTLDNLRTVPRVLLSDPITSLSGPRMHEVCRALAIATGCS